MNEPCPYCPVCEVVHDWPDWARAKVAAWAKDCQRFKDFIVANATKVRAKFSEAKEPGDVLVELEIGRGVLADPQFDLEYEPGGGDRNRGPDFRVRAGVLPDFFLEVKRTREAAASRAINEFVGAVVAAARGVPSGLGISVSLLPEATPSDLAERLAGARAGAVALCLSAIADSDAALSPGESRDYPVAGFDGEVVLSLIRLPDKPPDTPTADLGGCWAVPYTQKESFKFSEQVASCLGQLVEGAANVLVVKIDSSTHGPVELPKAMRELVGRADAGHDDYFSKRKAVSAAYFRRRWPALSAVVVKSVWSCTITGVSAGCVWVNPDAAVALPREVLAHLEAASRAEFLWPVRRQSPSG
jgi:hypothetical protein